MAEASATLLRSGGATAGDDLLLKRAIDLADPNILRLVLHDLTGDPSLEDMRTEVTQLWAGALFTYSLGEEHHELVRQMAFDYFQANPGRRVDPENPDKERIRRTMEMFGHGPMTDAQFRLGYEEAGFDPFPRGVSWTNRPPQELIDRFLVVIIGAGISGLAAAIHLEQLGMRYVLIERQEDLGGTWNFNNYPEARVDSTSLIYQYKFEKRYPWSEYFATAGETKKYLKYCAEKYNVANKIRFRSEVTDGEWDEDCSVWKLAVRDAQGETEHLSANFVISASGLFSTAKMPDIPGAEDFEGAIFHSTKWDHDFDLADKNVAQIGTGASGVQLMPAVARIAKTLTVFQRTPNWVLPMEGYKAPVSAELQWMLDHYPMYWYWHNYGMYFLNAQLEALQEQDPDWQASGGTINQRNDGLRETATAHIRTVLADRPDLIDKVIPPFPPMARRPTVDNGWYDALLRDNVALVTSGIARLEARAVVDNDGIRYPCDALICAAGFQTTRYLFPVDYRGRDGASFEDLWDKDGPRAYLGMTAPGFPNFFIFYGPNAQARGGSFYTVAEAWSRYALKAMVEVIENGHSSIEVRRDAFDHYNTEVDAATRALVWEDFGKGFYYVTEAGRSYVNVPFGSPEYHARMYAPDFAHFAVK